MITCAPSCARRLATANPRPMLQATQRATFLSSRCVTAAIASAASVPRRSMGAPKRSVSPSGLRSSSAILAERWTLAQYRGQGPGRPLPRPAAPCSQPLTSSYSPGRTSCLPCGSRRVPGGRRRPFTLFALAGAGLLREASSSPRDFDPGDPCHCTCGVGGVERRAEFSGLGPRAGCFLALGSGLGLVGTASSRR